MEGTSAACFKFGKGLIIKGKGSIIKGKGSAAPD